MKLIFRIRANFAGGLVTDHNIMHHVWEWGRKSTASFKGQQMPKIKGEEKQKESARLKNEMLGII